LAQPSGVFHSRKRIVSGMVFRPCPTMVARTSSWLCSVQPHSGFFDGAAE
jgi:hypothetical protein